MPENRTTQHALIRDFGPEKPQNGFLQGLSIPGMLKAACDLFIGTKPHPVLEPLSKVSQEAIQTARKEWGNVLRGRHQSESHDPTITQALKGMVIARAEALKLANLPQLAGQVDAVVGEYLRIASDGGTPSFDWRVKVSELMSQIPVIPRPGVKTTMTASHAMVEFSPQLSLNPLVNEVIWTTAELDIIASLGSVLAKSVQQATGKGIKEIISG